MDADLVAVWQPKTLTNADALHELEHIKDTRFRRYATEIYSWLWSNFQPDNRRLELGFNTTGTSGPVLVLRNVEPPFEGFANAAVSQPPHGITASFPTVSSDAQGKLVIQITYRLPPAPVPIPVPSVPPRDRSPPRKLYSPPPPRTPKQQSPSPPPPTRRSRSVMREMPSRRMPSRARSTARQHSSSSSPPPSPLQVRRSSRQRGRPPREQRSSSPVASSSLDSSEDEEKKKSRGFFGLW